MAVIPVQGTGLRHVRKTVAFDGSANNGQLDDYIPVFTTSGTVNITMVTIYCSEGLVCTAPTSTSLHLNAVDGNRLVGGMSSDGYAGAFWNDSYGEWRAIGSYQDGTAAVADELKLLVKDDGGGADVTDGTLIIDAWYYPITDDGALGGDDIDTELVGAVWSNSARVLTALDEDTTTIDLDATVRSAVGLSSADLDAQLGALPTSAEVATAVLTTTMTESYNEDGVAPTAAQALMAILQILSESSVSGTTMTVKKVDGSTTAFTLTLNDALTPTGITRAT